MKTAVVESASRPAQTKASEGTAPADEAAFADAMRKSSEALEQGGEQTEKENSSEAAQATPQTIEAATPEETGAPTTLEATRAALPVDPAFLATLGIAAPAEGAPVVAALGAAAPTTKQDALASDDTLSAGLESESGEPMEENVAEAIASNAGDGAVAASSIAMNATPVTSGKDLALEGSAEGPAGGSAEAPEELSAAETTDAAWKADEGGSEEDKPTEGNADASAQGEGAPDLTASPVDAAMSPESSPEIQAQPEVAPLSPEGQAAPETVKTPDASTANLWTVDAGPPRAATVVAQWRARSMHDRTATAAVASARSAFGTTGASSESELASELSGMSIGGSASDQDIGTSGADLKAETAVFSEGLSFTDFAGDSIGFVAPTPLNEARLEAALGNAEVPQQTAVPQRAPLTEMAGSALWTMRANHAHDASVELVHADLGRLRIDVKASRADVSVQIEAPTQIAAGVLQASEGALRASLGKRLRSFRVNAAGGSDAESAVAPRDDESPYESEDVK